MKLAVQEAAYGFTDVYKLTAAQITALGTGNQVKIATLPSGGIVTQAAVFEVVDFGGTSTNLTLDVGTTTADPDEFIDGLDLDALTKAAFCTGDGFTVGGDVGTGNGVVNNTANALNIVAEVNFTGTVTAGEWLICLTILDPGPLAQ
jgi:hypothetical protein